MSQEIIYTCDVCKQRIEGLYKPLNMRITQASFGARVYEGDICSNKCAIKWTADTLEKLGQFG